jgi:hypothetical protein
MALTPGQVRELERLGVDNARERLRYAGPGGRVDCAGTWRRQNAAQRRRGLARGTGQGGQKTSRKIARGYALVGKGSCMVLRSRDHCGSNRLFPCTLTWRRDGRSREDLAAGMRNEIQSRLCRLVRWSGRAPIPPAIDAGKGRPGPQ